MEPSLIAILLFSVAAPLPVSWNTLILKLSSTCPGMFSSGAGTLSGVVNALPSIVISSDVIPVAVAYAPPPYGAGMYDSDPPDMFVSTRFGSLIVTEPSEVDGRNINISPSLVCTYSPISITLVLPSPTNVGI